MRNTPIKYNHDKTLSEFEPQLSIIKKAGFKPIAVSKMYFEDVFVFETEEEATRAYRKLERDKNENWIGKVDGWWYGRNSFKDVVKEYEAKNKGFSKVRVYWL